MAYENKDNTGGLFIPRADTNIVYQGKIKVAGEDKDFLILSIKTKDGGSIYRLYSDCGGVKIVTPEEKEKYKSNPPSVKGGFNIGYVEYWLTGWTKTYNNGESKMLGISIEPKEEQPDIPNKPISENKNTMATDLDDDIPF
jgi:hypothetical protein